MFTYAVAKAGVNQITQFLARELAPHNIRVNAILPGFFPGRAKPQTAHPGAVASILGHTPMNRFGESCELVGAAVYLAAGASSFVTGSILKVDGGFTAMTDLSARDRPCLSGRISGPSKKPLKLGMASPAAAHSY